MRKQEKILISHEINTNDLDPNKELEKVKEAVIKFKKGKLNELTFRDKADIFLSNKMVKHAGLGWLSIMNLMNLFYGILHFGQRFLCYDELKGGILKRLENINNSFIDHKKKLI